MPTADFVASQAAMTAPATVNTEEMSREDLKLRVRTQLEYYFSRENLSGDMYLRSQMDNDQYVPIRIVANFNLMKKLTTDMNLIVEALRESPYVQVDESGEKVRPLLKRTTLILRGVPKGTEKHEVEKLFESPNCPRLVSCECALNDTWYANFDSDEDAQKAYLYLRNEVKTFKGNPILVRRFFFACCCCVVIVGFFSYFENFRLVSRPRPYHGSPTGTTTHAARTCRPPPTRRLPTTVTVTIRPQPLPPPQQPPPPQPRPLRICRVRPILPFSTRPDRRRSGPYPCRCNWPARSTVSPPTLPPDPRSAARRGPKRNLRPRRPPRPRP
ncbi:la-related protein 4 [Trichinella spiralis]|uniref:la-related protein 4 n=1 Tax=Trichinella spiralis TaxID=6334 RepID=UPI0001EFDBAB|nr:la-related protein 4 [Trichinella spiralis]